MGAKLVGAYIIKRSHGLYNQSDALKMLSINYCDAVHSCHSQQFTLIHLLSV